MSVTGPSIAVIGSQVVDLASVMYWRVSDQGLEVHLETDTFELDQADVPIEAEYVVYVDQAAFEAAMQAYLDSLNQDVGYLMTEDGDFIMTEDLDFIGT